MKDAYKLKKSDLPPHTRQNGLIDDYLLSQTHLTLLISQAYETMITSSLAMCETRCTCLPFEFQLEQVRVLLQNPNHSLAHTPFRCLILRQAPFRCRYRRERR